MCVGAGKRLELSGQGVLRTRIKNVCLRVHLCKLLLNRDTSECPLSMVLKAGVVGIPLLLTYLHLEGRGLVVDGDWLPFPGI